MPGVEITAGHRPLDEIEIHIVEAEPVKAPLECALYVPDPLRVVPDFSCNKEFFTRHAAGRDAASRCFFVPERGCRVKEPVTHKRSGSDGGFSLPFRVHLEGPEAEERHPGAGVESNRFIHEGIIT